MFERLKSALHFSDARESEQTDRESFYVAGRDRDNLPIPHSVKIEQVTESLDGTDFRWGCTGCGKCCNGPGVVYFTKTDLKKIQILLGIDDSRWERLVQRLVQKKTNGLFVHDTEKACIFLGKDSRCKIYSARPIQCRTYPFWTSCFEGSSGYQSLTAFCPGVNRKDGEHFPVPAITGSVNRTADEFNQSQTTKKKSLYL